MLLRTIVALVAPSMFAPFFRHWYCKPTPDAVTLNDTLAPSVTLVLCGWELMTGISTTVSVATMLVADPNRFVTTARYNPASACFNPVNVSTGFVAPRMFVKFNCHSYRSDGVPRAVTPKVTVEPTVPAALVG